MSDPVTYTGVLPIRASTAAVLAGLLQAERRRRGTRPGRRALDRHAHAVLLLRRFCDATGSANRPATTRSGSPPPTATCTKPSTSSPPPPDRHQALQAARDAGYTHLGLDGTVVRTDRVRPGPNPGVHLWWSGKHHHGGNIQVLTAPDGRPIWTSPVRPGRDKDVTCARTHQLPHVLSEWWNDTERVVLADLGYEGENTAFGCPVKNHRGRGLSTDQRTRNLPHSATRAVTERGNTGKGS